MHSTDRGESSATRALDRTLRRSPSLSGHGDLVRHMVATVAREIIEGELPSGHQLTSADLGRRFGTSRTPVREALGVLRREGLVDIEPRRRPRVATLSLPEVRDLYAIRASLYALIAESVIAGADDDRIARLDAPLARMWRARDRGDTLAYFDGTVDFRDVEVDICPNRSVGPLLESLGLRIHRLRRFGLSLPGRMDVSVRDYTYLVDAYRARDTDLARAVTRSMMAKALAEIERHWNRLELAGGSRRTA
ncbi:GntR family transcriptional regulator [Pseudonocardia zijingensis]|uniref:GntR family transcriptional regulator n=1 Tax=Pseudonocardia zijingensis TaxID=153376 RepID=UPI0031D79410